MWRAPPAHRSESEAAHGSGRARPGDRRLQVAAGHEGLRVVVLHASTPVSVVLRMSVPIHDTGISRKNVSSRRSRPGQTTPEILKASLMSPGSHSTGPSSMSRFLKHASDAHRRAQPSKLTRV